MAAAAGAKATHEVIRLDCKNLRSERQRLNNITVYELIQAKKYKELKAYINIKEAERVLNELKEDGIKDWDDLMEQCSANKILCRVLSGRIAKLASRQGSKDEELQIKTCGITATKCGITIKNLSATAYRPTKDGKIITAKQAKGICKTKCLKSMDAKITGKIKGWIFAKVCMGSGGHQDNVFHEAVQYCDWAKSFGKKDHIYVALIDTNLPWFKTLQQTYNKHKNIMVVNHVEFQEWMIKTDS